MRGATRRLDAASFRPGHRADREVIGTARTPSRRARPRPRRSGPQAVLRPRAWQAVRPHLHASDKHEGQNGTRGPRRQYVTRAPQRAVLERAMARQMLRHRAMRSMPLLLALLAPIAAGCGRAAEGATSDSARATVVGTAVFLDAETDAEGTHMDPAVPHAQRGRVWLTLMGPRRYRRRRLSRRIARGGYRRVLQRSGGEAELDGEGNIRDAAVPVVHAADVHARRLPRKAARGARPVRPLAAARGVAPSPVVLPRPVRRTCAATMRSIAASA